MRTELMLKRELFKGNSFWNRRKCHKITPSKATRAGTGTAPPPATFIWGKTTRVSHTVRYFYIIMSDFQPPLPALPISLVLSFLISDNYGRNRNEKAPSQPEPPNGTGLGAITADLLLFKLLIFIQFLYKSQHWGSRVLLLIFHNQS